MPKFIYDIIPPEIKRRAIIAAQEVSKWIKFLRMFLKTSKYGIPLLIIIVVGFGALLVFAFQPKREIIEVFPTEYRSETWSEEVVSESEGMKWQNGENALQRELSEEASLAEFSSENSAVLFGGEVEGLSSESDPVGELATESEEIFDEFISEEPTTENEQLEEIIEEEVAGTATESGEILEEPEPEPEPPAPSEEGEGQAEPEEIPEGIGGCEFCEDEDVASDAEDLLNLMEEVEEVASISQPPLISQSITFSGFGFGASNSIRPFEKVKIMFSFAAEEREGNDTLSLSYKIASGSVGSEEWKTLALIQLNKEHSNSLNNGYWQEEIEDFNSWQDLENLEVRFTVTSNNPDDHSAVYLDCVWLHIEFPKSEKTEINSLIREKLADVYELKLVSDKKDFKINEDLAFKFHFQRRSTREESKGEDVLASLKSTNEIATASFEEGVSSESLEPIVSSESLGLIVSSQSPEEVVSPSLKGSEASYFGPVGINTIKAVILDSNGEALNKLSPQIEHQENGDIVVSLGKQNLKKFRPGKYKLKIEIENNEGIFIGEQEFTWGVLAINTNKSIYLPGETAYLQMAALKDDGHTICDANLKLEIISPDGGQFSVSVQKSEECGPDNVTYVPDYFAYYQVDVPGIYEMKLTNLDNGYEITDSFEVRGFVFFDIERIGPTRIYPPAIYEMVIKIKINQDFEGRIVETVPAGFETKYEELRIKKKGWNEFVIFEQEFLIQQKNKNEQNLIWQNTPLNPGDELELRYMFDAPDISPYLYLLGPLEFYQ